MAHAQKPHFVFRRNGRVHLNRRGRQFSRLLAAEVCASAVVMLDTPCSDVVWRVLATHVIHQFPLHFPSRASLCAITFQLESTTRLYEVQWGQQLLCVVLPAHLLRGAYVMSGYLRGRKVTTDRRLLTWAIWNRRTNSLTNSNALCIFSMNNDGKPLGMFHTGNWMLRQFPMCINLRFW